MITHIVLAKLKDNRAENVESTRALLRSMDGKISTVRHLEVGKNIGSSEWAYDISLIAKFRDMAGLRTYEEHPVHLPISNRQEESASSIVVVDYESD